MATFGTYAFPVLRTTYAWASDKVARDAARDAERAATSPTHALGEVASRIGESVRQALAHLSALLPPRPPRAPPPPPPPPPLSPPPPPPPRATADAATLTARIMLAPAAADVARYKAALRREPEEVLASTPGFDAFTVADLRLLCPGAWLNDSCVNTFAILLRRIGAACIAAGGAHARTWVATSFFYTRMCTGGFDYAGVKRWTKLVDVFACDRVLFPINRDNVHWALAVVDMRARTVFYCDSLRGDGSEVVARLLRWVEAEHREKKGAPLPAPFAAADAPANLPRQTNGCDCGAFVCAMMMFFLYGIAPRDGEHFSQADLGLWRQKISLACFDQALADVALLT
jgi:hypothetical protein